MTKNTNGPVPFDQYLEAELQKIRGIWYPVKCGLTQRLLKRYANIRTLHPNPNDEFCDPKIGPSHSVLSGYEAELRRLHTHKVRRSFESRVNEPLEVQKIRPDGYLILNGHHRWGAAYKTGVTTLPIHIVDLTQKSDLENMLKASKHDRRVAFDLDETVLQLLPGTKDGLEKPMPFFLRRFCRERIRLGIPALFQFLAQKGYDVWVYTDRYLSLDHLRFLFMYYHCPVTGMITGMGRKSPLGADMKKKMEDLLETRYASTLHVDSETVLKTIAHSKEYEILPLNLSSVTWSQAVMDTVSRL